MSKHQTLRDLVNARLNAAAEEIFAMFERTIVEYEAELCRCVEENQRKQQRLDMVFNPRVVLHRAGTADYVPSPSPPLPPNQKTTETAQIKEEEEEQSIKEEEEQPPLSVCVKTEELPLIVQVETVETVQGEDINPEPHVQPQTEPSSDTDNDENGESAAEMETGADGDSHNKVQDTQESTAAPPALSSVVMPKSAPRNNSIVLGTDKGAKKRNHVCTICQKRFRRERELERHIRVHTGERPYSCTICTKTFSQQIHLKVHLRTHSSEKPYSCTACSKTFTQKIHLEVHLRTHTGQRPYRCSVCKKTFTQKVYRQQHMSTHKENQ